MNDAADLTCTACSADRWGSDRYCWQCGHEAEHSNAGVDFGPLDDDGHPTIVGDAGRTDTRGRLVAAACIAAMLIGGGVLFALTRPPQPGEVESQDALAVPTADADEPADPVAIDEAQADPTPESVVEVMSDADVSVDMAALRDHELSAGRVVLTDDNDVVVVDLVSGEMSVLFDDVNFFEVVAVGNNGITAALGFHRAEMSGPGALRHITYSGEQRVVGSIGDFVGGGDVLFFRVAADGRAGEWLRMFDTTSGADVEFQVPLGATSSIVGDAVVAQAGSRLFRMGAGLDDWEQTGTGRMEPLLDHGLLAFDCVSEDAADETCSVDFYTGDGLLALRHNRRSPMLESRVLQGPAHKVLSRRGDLMIQLINPGGGGIWDLKAGLLSALVFDQVIEPRWLLDDSALIGRIQRESALVHVDAVTGQTSELGIDTGRYRVLGLTGESPVR